MCYAVAEFGGFEVQGAAWKVFEGFREPGGGYGGAFGGHCGDLVLRLVGRVPSRTIQEFRRLIAVLWDQLLQMDMRSNTNLS